MWLRLFFLTTKYKIMKKDFDREDVSLKGRQLNNLYNEITRMCYRSMYGKIEDILSKLPHNAICLDKEHTRADAIYGYYLDWRMDSIVECEVKGLFLRKDGEKRDVYAILDNGCTYTLEDVLSASKNDDDDSCYSLRYGAELLMFTTINIAELLTYALDEDECIYLKEELND